MKFNSSGDYCASGGSRTGDARASLNGQIIASLSTTGYEANGIAWIGSNRLLMQVYGGAMTGAALFTHPDGLLIEPRGANVLHGDEFGVWAAALDGFGMFTSTGFNLPAGWGPAAVGPDGAIAYAPHAAFPIRVREFDGSDWELSAQLLGGQVTAVQLLGQRRAVLSSRSSQQSFVHAVGIPQPHGMPRFFGGFRARIVNGRAWCAYHDEANLRVVLRPFDDPTRGYIVPANLCWGLDFVALGDTFRLGFAIAEGDQPADQIVTSFTPADLRDLTVDDEEPMPNRDFAAEILTAANAENQIDPSLIATNSHESAGIFTERVVLRLHRQDVEYGHVGKVPGQNQYRGHAVDAVMRRGTTEVWDFLKNAGDGPGVGGIAITPKGPTTQPWVDPDTLSDTPPPPPPPPPPIDKHVYDGGENDTGTCDRCGKPKADPIHVVEDDGTATELEILQLRVTSLTTDLIALTVRVNALTAILAEHSHPPAPAPAIDYEVAAREIAWRLRAKSNGGFLGHRHATEVIPPTERGPKP